MVSRRLRFPDRLPRQHDLARGELYAPRQRPLAVAVWIPAGFCRRRETLRGSRPRHRYGTAGRVRGLRDHHFLTPVILNGEAGATPTAEAVVRDISSPNPPGIPAKSIRRCTPARLLGGY